jgi:hypothetical protein
MRADAVRSLHGFTFPEDTMTTTVTTFEGLVVTARLAAINGKTYANFDFSAIPSASAAATDPGEHTAPAGTVNPVVPEHVPPEKEAEMLKARHAEWVYQIPDFIYEALTSRLDQAAKLPLIPGEN